MTAARTFLYLPALLVSPPDDFLILSDKFFEKYRRFGHEGSAFYHAPDIKDRNLNMILLKDYIEKTGLFSTDEIDEAIRLRFHR